MCTEDFKEGKETTLCGRNKDNFKERNIESNSTILVDSALTSRVNIIGESTLDLNMFGTLTTHFQIAYKKT
jgi:hypothetical protein